MDQPASFQWDESKNRENLRKHRVSFQQAALIFQGDVLQWTDTREDYGEERIVSIGRVDRTILCVVHTWRDNDRRIISARKATRYERALYLSIYA